MVILPLSCVLRGLLAAMYSTVRLAKSPCAALLNETIPHL